jgi:hypothetical protein
VLREDDDALTPDEEWGVIQEIKGEPIAYRVRDPKPDDLDTFLMMPRKKSIGGYAVHTWAIAQDVKTRERSKYDKGNDELKSELVQADEIRHTKFIAIPKLGVFAVDDSISDRTLGARSAVSRFAAVVETLVDNTTVEVNFAGTPDDAQKALETWKLDEFSFTVRPFNPTVRKLGEKMHELLVADGVGSLQAVARPTEGKDMKDSHEGLISEAKGLTEAGYGQYGARGTTPDGLQASLSKPKFTMTRTRTSRRRLKIGR